MNFIPYLKAGSLNNIGYKN